MKTERTLFPEDPPDKPPHNATATSRKAAESMKHRRETQQERIVEFLRARGPRGATREELEINLKINGNSLRPRMKELEQQGVVKNSGNKRPTLSGRDAEVFVYVPNRAAEANRQAP